MHVGFDIGGTTARATLYEPRSDGWEARARTRRGVREASEPDAVVDLVAAMLGELCESAEVDSKAVASVGLGIAGQLNAEGTVVRNAPNLGWRDEAFAARAEDALRDGFGQVHVRLVNDLNAALWGEATAGVLQDVDDALAVFVGTGVGGAILADGRLVVGAGGNAGEIGHSKVEPGGRLCGCGERGCIEAYAGGIHLEEQVAAIAREEGLDEVFDADSVDLGKADALSEQVDALDALWREVTDLLAMVVANACTLLNPGALLLGGGVLTHAESYRRRLLTKVPPLVLEVAREDLEIRFPELGDEAGVVGAARLAAGS